MPNILPPEVEDLRWRTGAFIRGTVLPREPGPGARMPQETRNELQSLRISDGINETYKWAISRRASGRRRKEVQNGEPFRGQASIRTAEDPL
jgi:hypothetical protein